MYFATMNQKALVLFLAMSCHFHATASQDNNNNIDNKDIGDKTSHIPIHNTHLEDIRIFSKDSYDEKEPGRIAVEVKAVTTSTIHVRWSLPETRFNDSVLESSVVCETSNGLMFSKRNATSRSDFRLENLHSNTSYFVCVYMLEKSRSSNTRVLHYSCHLFKTDLPYAEIPSMRTDSIVAVVLTLGYITVMIIIGYATWRWKKKMKEQDEAKQKLAIEDDDYGEDDGMINGGHRDNNYSRGSSGGGGGGGGRGGDIHGSWRGAGSPSSFGYSGSVDDLGGQKEKESLRSSNHGLNNSDRFRGGGRGNSVDFVAASDGNIDMRKSNSADEVNGCLDFKRNNKGSAVKLTDLAENGNSQEKNRPKSQSVEDSPVKVTEITF